MSKFSNSTDEIRSKVVDKLNSVIHNKYLSKTIEKGIYNYVIETAKESIQVFKDLIALKTDIETSRLPRLGRKAEKAQVLIKQLYKIPIIDSKQISEFLKISPSTANRLIYDLIDLKILSELTGYKRNRKYIFKEYFKIFHEE